MIHDVNPNAYTAVARGPSGPGRASTVVNLQPVRTIVLPENAQAHPVDRIEERLTRSAHTDTVFAENVRLRDVNCFNVPVVAIPRNPIVDEFQPQQELAYGRGGALQNLRNNNTDAAIILPRLAMADRNLQMANQILRQETLIPSNVLGVVRLYCSTGLDALVGTAYFVDAVWRNAWAGFFATFGLQL